MKLRSLLDNKEELFYSVLGQKHYSLDVGQLGLFPRYFRLKSRA